MLSRYSHIFFVPALLLSYLLFMSSLHGCRPIEPELSHISTIDNKAIGDVIVYQTDSTEWHVYIFKTGVLYGSGYTVDSPYHIPNRDEAIILRTISYGASGQRYVTCDGYTFGMPSVNVSKAGLKTKYSVIGLWQRKNIIKMSF